MNTLKRGLQTSKLPKSVFIDYTLYRLQYQSGLVGLWAAHVSNDLSVLAAHWH